MISYWREHRRRRWCLHLRNHALAGLMTDDRNSAASEPLPSAALVPSVQAPPRRVEVIHPAGVKLSLPLTELVTFIGSGRDCRWRFADAGLDAKHYAMVHLDGAVYGLDLHAARSNPATAIGRWWNSTERLCIGSLRLQWRAPEDLVQLPRLPPLFVQWTASGRVFREALRARITLFGASRWCPVRLSTNGIAPVQAIVIRQPDALVVVDVADNTWTRREGQPVRWAALEPGDRFDIGRTTFQVQSEWSEPEATHLAIDLPLVNSM